MELQNFLRNRGTIQDLNDRFAINAVPHKKYSNLILFKYNQIESPFAEQIVRESRGVILDRDDDWKVVSRPFDKFFNSGEGFCAQINWNSARVLEKIDGSLSTLFVYNNEWHISSSGSADASGNVNDYGFTFAELFWEAFQNSIGDKSNLPDLNCGVCFIFELTSKYNKIVVRYDEPAITLIGARNIHTQQELTLEEAVKFFPKSIPVVKSFNLFSYEEIEKTFPTLSPLSQEGYIVVDRYFNRAKVKSPAYIALHHLKDSMANSKKNLVSVALNGEIEEVVSAFPEFKDFLEEVKSKIDDLIRTLEIQYQEIQGYTNQKDFAMQAVLTKCPSALFSLRAKKVNSISEFIRNMRLENVVSMLGYK